MIRYLLTPEAHRDPYVWAVVLLAHFAIGAMLWPLVGWWVALIYAAVEAAQAVRVRLLAWDCVLDWIGVMLGAAFVWQVAAGDYWMATAAAVAALSIAAVGAGTRWKEPA